jgi:hypothetical protein
MQRLAQLPLEMGTVQRLVPKDSLFLDSAMDLQMSNVVFQIELLRRQLWLQLLQLWFLALHLKVKEFVPQVVPAESFYLDSVMDLQASSAVFLNVLLRR